MTGGFVPSPGDGFAVLTYGSRASAFSSINGLDLTGLAPNLMLQPVYTPTELALVAYLDNDMTPPAASSTPDLTAASDLGDSAIDNLTADSTPTFRGTSEPGASIELFESGTTSLGTGVAGSDGTWVITSSALSDGLHNTITVIATDISGNIGPHSAAASVEIETIADAGHWLHVEQVQAFSTAVTRFLQLKI